MAIPVIVTGAAGRMGSTLIRLTREAGDLELVAVLERPGMESTLAGHDCLQCVKPEEALGAHPAAVVVDFTSPEATLATVEAASRFGNPVIIGTTGFTPEQELVLRRHAEKIPLFRSPNMSVGVNVLLKILPELTRLLGADYDIDIVELHHNKKKDAPSGTALRLAACLAETRGWQNPDALCCCREGIIGVRPKVEIGVQAVRGGDIAGVHTVYFMGPGERIELTHHAHSRENFAWGALHAARRLFTAKPGKLYDMSDIL